MDTGFTLLVDALHGYTSAIKAERETHSGVFAGASTAAEESEDERYMDEWGEFPTRDALLGPGLVTNSMVDHLTVLGLAIDCPDSVYSAETLGRAALEAAASAWHLLTAESPRERIRRYQNMALEDSHSTYFAIRSIADDDDLREAGMQFERDKIGRILRSAGRHGFDARPMSRNERRAPYLDKPQLTKMQLVKDVLDAHNAHLGGIYYHRLSSVAHSRLPGLANYFTDRAYLLDRTSGDVQVNVSTTPKETAIPLCGPMLAAYVTTEQLVKRYGWNEHTIHEAGQRLILTFGRVAQIVDDSAETSAKVPLAFRRASRSAQNE
jgi:hypothetical protein